MLISGATPCYSRIRSVQQPDAWVFRPSGQHRATVDKPATARRGTVRTPIYGPRRTGIGGRNCGGGAGDRAGGGGAAETCGAASSGGGVTGTGARAGIAADCGGDTEILKGEAVLCLLGAANRDPAVICAPRCDRRTLN